MIKKLKEYRKAVVAILPAAAGLLLLAGIDVSRELEIVGGVILIPVPIAIYYLKNEGQIDLPFARKAIAGLGSTIVGLALLFNIDVSAQVDEAVALVLPILPFIVAFLSNDGGGGITHIQQEITAGHEQTIQG